MDNSNPENVIERNYRVSESKKVAIDNALVATKSILSALEEMKYGHLETTVCKKYNLNKNNFRRFVFGKHFGFEYNPFDKNGDYEEDKNKTKLYKKYDLLSWQELLFCDVMYEDDYCQIPPDIEETLEFILDPGKGFLTKNEIKVLRHIYEDGGNRSDCVDDIGVTRERIRQIYNNALNKLHTPKIRKLMVLGIDYINASAKIRSERYSLLRSEELEKLRVRLDALGERAMLKDALDLKAEIDAYIALNYPDDVNNGNTHIDCFGLSASTYNKFRRNGFNTTADFEGKKFSDLMQLHGVGLRAVSEVAEKLKKLNVEIIDDIGAGWRE